MFVTLPLTIAWLMLGFAQSFPVVCLGFALSGFSFGLKVISNLSLITLFFEIILKYYKISKEAPSLTYVSEISEPEVRGTLLTISGFFSNFAIFLVLGLGSFLPWRQISFICAVCPLACLIAVSFVSFIQSSIWYNQQILLLNVTSRIWADACASAYALCTQSSLNQFVCRFQNHRIGYCQKIVQKMRKNHYNGNMVKLILIQKSKKAWGLE